MKKGLFYSLFFASLIFIGLSFHANSVSQDFFERAQASYKKGGVTGFLKEMKLKGKGELCGLMGAVNTDKQTKDLCEFLVCPLGSAWSTLGSLPGVKDLAKKAALSCSCACQERGHPNAYKALQSLI